MYSPSRPEFQPARDSDVEALLESDETYRLLFRRMLNGVAFCKMLFDDDGQPYDYVNLKVNHVFAALTGLKDIEGKRITEIMPDFRKSQSAQFDAYARVAQCGQPEQFETYVEPLQRWFLISVYSPRHGYFVVVFDDITERKKAEEELRLASLVYQASSEAMTVTDASGTILAVNPAFTTLTGYEPEEVMGKTPRILKSGHHGRDFYDAMWHDLNTKGQWQGEIWNRRKNGEIYPEWLSINSTFNEDGSAHRRVALFSDITKKKQLEELLWQQANIDLLTGLPNRRMFLDRMDQEIRKAEQSNSSLALLSLDLDYFKDINDTLGHGQGDLLLKQVAQRLESCLRPSDLVARLGGDEFTIVVPEPARCEMVDGLAQDILRQLAVPFQLGENQTYVTASIGITVYPADASEPEDLLKNADQAMYAAKTNGRNRCQYFTPSLHEAAQARMRLINDLRIAIKDGQFRLVYQPIVELSTGIVQKAEALIRWHHPALGPISPSDFITVAEETGMIVEIGDWVFRQAASQARRLRALCDPGFQVSVNKSPVQFLNDERLYKSWLDHLDDMKLSGDALVIEITESSMMDGADIVIDKLNVFRRAGMQLSLDDFGTGYSSISYLKKFDFDYLKIDQSFVRNLTADSDDMALCEAIIAMASKLGIKVIAEGVETEEQRALLADAGCDYAQGYLFSRPMPAEELEKMLQAGQIAAPSVASTCDLQM